MTREAMVKDTAAKYAGEKVLGIRVHFPTEPFNSWAIATPPFDIPAYMDATQLQDDALTVPQEEVGKGTKFDNYGVVKNVGVLKSVSITLLGLNFPHGLSIVLEDQNGEEKHIFMGYLAFDGWKTLTWNNPNYITEVRNRELRTFPLYPESAPLYKLSGILIHRDGAHKGGNFITYVRDIKMTYDKAILTLKRDVDDENVWGILQERERARRAAELNRLGKLQALRYLEQLKMHAEATAEQ